MSTTLVLVLILVFSFAASRLARGVASRHLILSGSEYVLVGLLLGPLVTRVASHEALEALDPFLSLVLGLVGFGIGIDLRRRVHGSAVLGGGVLAFAIIGGVVAAGVWGLQLAHEPSHLPPEALWLALSLGCAAAVCEVSVVDRGAQLFSSRGPVTDLLKGVSFASSLVALCAFGVILDLARARDVSNLLGLSETEWLALTLAVGGACGLLFALFTGRGDDTQRTFLATVGVVTFAAGLAAGMEVSPLLVCAAAGLTVSLVSPRADELALALERLERPALVIILVFAGATWRPPVGIAWLIPVAYLVLRYAALRLAVPLALRTVGDEEAPARSGEALLAQGGLAAAIAVNSGQVQPETSSVILTAVLLGLLVNDLVSARALRRVLADSGEIRHDLDQAEPADAPREAGA